MCGRSWASVMSEAPAPGAGLLHGDGKPSDWVMRGLAMLPRGARVLDFASGRGRHARAAGQMQLIVTAADRDAAALAAVGGRIECVMTDLEADPWPFVAGSFDAVIVTNYLYRPRFAELCGLLSPAGLLIYETFALGNERYGRPSNPDFLLAEGELLERARQAGLRVLAYESGFAGSGRQACIQRILAVGQSAKAEAFAIE